MTKFLNKLSVFLVLFMISITLSRQGVTSSKASSFRKFLEAYGTSITILEEVNEDEVENSDILLILSSELLQDSSISLDILSNEFGLLVLICDVYFEHSAFNCSNKNIHGQTLVQAIIFEGDTILDSVMSNSLFLDDSRLEVVTENIFLQPASKARYGEYLKGLFIAEGYVKDDAKYSDIPLIKTISSALASQTLLSVVGYTFVFYILFFIITRYKKFFTSGFLTILKKLYKITLTVRNVALYLWVGLLSFIGFAGYLISIRDRGYFSPRYLLYYIENLFSLENFIAKIQAEAYFSMMLYFAFNLLFLLTTLLLIPTILEIIGFLALRLYSLRVKKRKYRNILFTLVISISVFSPLPFFGYPGHLLVAFSVFWTLFLFDTFREGLKISEILYLDEKILLCFLSLFLFFGSLLFSFMFPYKISTEVMSLVSPKKSVVLLPYRIPIKQNALFKKISFEGDALLYINDYIVHHPAYSTVQNKRLSSFKDEGSYVVRSNSKDALIKVLFENSGLKKVLTTYNISSIFYIEDFVNSDELYIWDLVVDCSLHPDSFEMEAKIFYLDKESKKLKSRKNILAHIPGCVDDYKGLVTYKIPWDVSNKFDGQLIFKLSTEDMLGIQSLRLIEGGRYVDFKYIKGSMDDEIYIIHNRPSSVFTSYGSDSEEFEYSYDPKDFNLADPINKLLELDYLEKNIKIWSLFKGTVFLQNELDD